MQNELPWAGLNPGGVDSRRVSAGGKWNLFWAVFPKREAALVFRLARLPEAMPDLPKLRNLEIAFQSLNGEHIFYLRLKDASQIELFETLCWSVVTAAEGADTEEDALKKSVARTFRWHQLLRSGQVGVLSEEEQKGLIGEIQVLKRLIACRGAKEAITAWVGPSGTPKDFELGGHCIEVKARRGAAQPFIRISNEYQLAQVAGQETWLIVTTVDQTPPPHGLTLSEIVAEVGSMLQSSQPSVMNDWLSRLSDAGFDPDDDYSEWHWTASLTDSFSVTPDFPCISTPVPVGVSSVTYSLALSACGPFRVDWSVIESRLARRIFNE